VVRFPDPFRCAAETIPPRRCTSEATLENVGSALSTKAGRPRPRYLSNASSRVRTTPALRRARATCGRPSAPPADCASTDSSSMATPSCCRRRTISIPRRLRSSRHRARNSSSSGAPAGRKYARTCISPHGASTENSHPETTLIPSAVPAAIAAGTPDTVS
jgi:hypothetical protein